MSRRSRRLGYAILGVSMAFIAAMTLTPHPEAAAQAASTPLACLACGDRAGVDILLNILLFVPLGIGLALSGFTWRRALVLAALLSFSVESLQMKVVVGRDASLGDLLTNTIGGGIGACLGIHWRSFVFPSPAVSRWLAAGWAAGLVVIWAGTSWALAPLWPRDVDWVGQWAPDLVSLERFPGVPLAVTAGDDPMLPGLPLDQARFQATIAARPEVAVRAVMGGPTHRLAPIASVFDLWEREVILLGQRGEDLQFRTRMRAARWRLRIPAVALPGALNLRPGDTVEAMGALRNGRYELAVRQGDRLESRSLALTPSWGWSLVLPWDYAFGGEVYSLTALWIGGLLAILAYWGHRAGYPASLLGPLMAVMLLALIPRWGGFPPTHWSEWAAAAAGILAGAAAARLERRHAPKEVGEG